MACVDGFVQSNVSGKWEATHMNSSEGENIMFLSSTILEGPVEVGLGTLQAIFDNSMYAYCADH